jgi:hypothetical protein
MIDRDMTGKSEVEINEIYAGHLLNGQKRWGGVLFSGDAEGGLRRLVDVSIALQRAGHKLVVDFVDHNTATQKLYETADKWAKTNPTVDIRMYNSVQPSAPTPAPAKPAAPVKVVKPKAKPRDEATEDLWDDQDDENLDRGNDEDDASCNRPSGPTPFDE